MMFEIPGKPIAKGRPRVTRRGITYTPKETVRFENLVKLCAQNAGVKFLDGPVYLSIMFYWPCKGARKNNPRREEVKTTRPDCDNCIKAIADSLNGIAYKDDAQVVSVVAAKFHAAQGEPARTIVQIGRIPE